MQHFSALQRAEIAEIVTAVPKNSYIGDFSALQRAEIAEIRGSFKRRLKRWSHFSALQRAEIAEIQALFALRRQTTTISVLFNEPKLLKSSAASTFAAFGDNFSALQRAEIAEIRKCHNTFYK